MRAYVREEEAECLIRVDLWYILKCNILTSKELTVTLGTYRYGTVRPGTSRAIIPRPVLMHGSLCRYTTIAMLSQRL